MERNYRPKPPLFDVNFFPLNVGIKPVCYETPKKQNQTFNKSNHPPCRACALCTQCRDYMDRTTQHPASKVGNNSLPGSQNYSPKRMEQDGATRTLLQDQTRTKPPESQLWTPELILVKITMNLQIKILHSWQIHSSRFKVYSFSLSLSQLKFSLFYLIPQLFMSRLTCPRTC